MNSKALFNARRLLSSTLIAFIKDMFIIFYVILTEILLLKYWGFLIYK